MLRRRKGAARFGSSVLSSSGITFPGLGNRLLLVEDYYHLVKEVKFFLGRLRAFSIVDHLTTRIYSDCGILWEFVSCLLAA